jgi:hypothetical protein
VQPFAPEPLAVEDGILAAAVDARKGRLPVLTAFRSTPLRFAPPLRASPAAPSVSMMGETS